MIVLGIETSCDDTSVALLRGTGTTRPEVLGVRYFGQEDILRKWGGVVPEIAARNHLMKLKPLLAELFESTKTKASEVDLIGMTTHPGLLGPLLTGLNAAKSISLLHQTPILPVNHLYAHLEAIFIDQEVSYPYLGLLVSGGHSLFMLVRSERDFEVLGTTIDDAAGEAFDKGGKLMGLGYPAGRLIDEYAQKGDSSFHEFPIGLKKSGDANLSFSGLKTSLRTWTQNHPDADLSIESKTLHDLCASYQGAIVRALDLKLRYALKQARELTGLPNIPIVLGGGVACNSGLRNHLKNKYQNVLMVSPQYCTDNGAMIANYALRTHQDKIDYPKCLALDAKGRFIEKTEAQS